MDRRIFTTGQVARICKVSQAKVSGWFDQGLLKGFRIPELDGGGDRRIPSEELDRFLADHHMPPRTLPDTPLQIGMMGGQKELANEVERELSSDVRLETAYSVFEAGMLLASKPDFLMIDVTAPFLSNPKLIAQVNESQRTHGTPFGLYLPEGCGAHLFDDLLSERFSCPIHSPLLAARMETLARRFRGCRSSQV